MAQRRGQAGRRRVLDDRAAGRLFRQVAQRRGQAGRRRAPERPFQRDGGAVPRPPEQQRPAPAVPDRDQQEQQEQRKRRLRLPSRGPARFRPQRKPQVDVEPGRQGHRPAPPEAVQAVRRVRPLEVFRQPEPEHASQAESHVGVAGQREVDLQREAGEAEPRVRRVERVRRHRERRLGRRRQRPGEEPRLRQSDGEAPHAVGERRHAHLPRRELGAHVPEPDEGAGDQQGEEEQVGQRVDRIPRRRRLAAMDVGGVRHRVAGEDRQPERREQAGRRERRGGERVEPRPDLSRGGGEVAAVREQEQGAGDREREADLRNGADAVRPGRRAGAPPAGDAAAEEVQQQGGGARHGGEPAGPCREEPEAAGDEDPVGGVEPRPPAGRAVRGEPRGQGVQAEDDRQEDDEEPPVGEGHAPAMLSPAPGVPPAGGCAVPAPRRPRGPVSSPRPGASRWRRG